MSTLLLHLAGPLQSWGSSSRHIHRRTESAPTKSGIVGMLASALGRLRTDDVSDLAALRFGVRTDVPGKVMRDFHTVDFGKNNPSLTYRHYLQGAVFLVGIEGGRRTLEELDRALTNPARPLFLGRRACLPSTKISLGVVDEPLDAALTSHPWLGVGEPPASLVYHRDPEPGSDERGVYLPDHPVSFDSAGRRYIMRESVRLQFDLPTPETGETSDEHNPIAFLEGSCS